MELKKAATVGTLEYGPAAFEKADRWTGRRCPDGPPVWYGLLILARLFFCNVLYGWHQSVQKVQELPTESSYKHKMRTTLYEVVRILLS